MTSDDAVLRACFYYYYKNSVCWPTMKTPMNQLTKGEICATRSPAKPFQVLRPTDSPIQSLPFGLSDICLISKAMYNLFLYHVNILPCPGPRHCRNLRQLQLRNHLEVWPLPTLADQEAGIQVGFLTSMQNARTTNPPPTRYVGYGPTKNYAVKALRRKRCPVKCRPEAHKDWEYC